LSGRHNASALDDKQLDALAHALLDIPRLSYRTRGRWMRINIMARCSALRFSIAMAKSASAAAGLSRKRCSRRGRFTGVRDASISDKNAPSGALFLSAALPVNSAHIVSF
jgi:endonuclease-8